MAQTNPAQGAWVKYSRTSWMVGSIFCTPDKDCKAAWANPDWFMLAKKVEDTLEQPSMIYSNLVTSLLTIWNTIHQDPMSTDTPIVCQHTSHHKLVAFVLDKSSRADPSWNCSMAILRKSKCKATMFAQTILICFGSMCWKHLVETLGSASLRMTICSLQVSARKEK